MDDPKTLGRTRLSFAGEADIDEFVGTLERVERGDRSFSTVQLSARGHRVPPRVDGPRTSREHTSRRLSTPELLAETA